MTAIAETKTVNLFGRKTESVFLTLARRRDLDNETAYTVCRMIDSVGHDVVDDWDWDWLDDENPNADFRAKIDPSILEKVWKKLVKKDWFSLQATNDDMKKISTIAPL